MKRSAADNARSARVAQLGALLMAGALSLAVFYHGRQIPLLAGAEILLVTWMALSLAQSYADGIRIPLTPVSATMTFFWLWLGVSLTWSAVLVTSVINFWWVGSVALAFWAYTLSPQRERVWFYGSRFALAGALLLCAYALAQLFLWGLPPRATFVNIHSFAALMMLVALPLAAYFLIAWHKRSDAKVLYALAGSLFILFFTIAATEGRGTALSILVALFVLAALAVRSVGIKPVAALAGLVLAAYGGANLILHGGFAEGRLATLVDPASAGVPRFLIWAGSWEMLSASPWWGIGLGTYYLAWPPFRHPDDATLGFFVHNDYLQIWIEAGLPALLLLLAVYVSVLVMLVRAWRHARASATVRLEVLGLFAGLLSVAAHSFVDFNLYILPISIAAGIALGRFHERAGEVLRPRLHVLRPLRLTPVAYRAIVVLIALFPLSYFVSLGVSDHLYKRGFALAGEGKLPEADDAFVWAERLLPRDDKVLTMHADLYRHVLQRLPRENETERLALYEAALAMLDEAQSANPYRPLVLAIRARLLHENPDLAGADWRERVEASYRKALALDPRFVATRTAYARFLLEAGREAEAYGVLNGGIAYWYYPAEPVLLYYDLTAQVAERLGADTDAAEIRGRTEVLRKTMRVLAPRRPVVPDVALPATASAI